MLLLGRFYDKLYLKQIQNLTGKNMNDSANVTTLKTISEPDYNKIDNIAVIYYYSNEYIHNVSVSPFKEIQQYAPPPLSFFSKLYLITDGECTIRINKKMYTCRKNDLILIRKYKNGFC